MLGLKNKLIISGDGSHTLYVPELDEHYHSIFGAIQESEHVFIRGGLEQINKEEINILEVGFGTGLNTLLTYLTTNSDKKKIYYNAIEPFPLEMEICDKLNYTDQIEIGDAKTIFKKIHKEAWGRVVSISESFELLKTKATLEEIILEKNFYDLVYFDAFAPDVHPHLWSEEIFKKINSSMKESGILVTYSSKGSVKRALRSVGFVVKRLPGPKGKHHMLRAMK